ncbi:MAG: ABC transporter permease [Thermomicrobiales bacterium]|nr:ABC transporter permease [Thermomicrobiales bacterium]
MQPFLAMIVANLKMTARNRTALFWNLVFPAIFILIFGAVFSNDQIDVTVGVAGEQSAFSDGVIESLRSNDIFTVETGGTAQDEIAALEESDRDIVLIFGAPGASGMPAMDLYYDETAGPNSSIGISAVQQTLLSVAQSENPLDVTVQPVTGADITFMDFFLPGILAMAIMNSGVIGLSTSFVTYRERGILRRIKVTPFALKSFIGARVVSQLIVAVPQALILIAIAWLFFDFHLRGNPLVILLAIVLGSLAFLAVGFAVSSIARNVETAASYSNLITFPMLFLSGVFFSLDNAPSWLQPVTRVLPLSYLVDALREPMTRNNGIGAIWTDLLVLVATFVVAMVIAVRFFKWESRTA